MVRSVGRFAFRTLEGWALLIFVFLTAPAIWITQFEGYFYPANSDLVIESIEPFGDRSALIKGYAVKERDGCDWRETQWSLGSRDGRSVFVDVSFLDKPQIRGAGRIEWEGIVVGLTPEQVVLTSFSDVVHQCHKGLFSWALTTTQFYTGRGQDLPKINLSPNR